MLHMPAVSLRPDSRRPTTARPFDPVVSVHEAILVLIDVGAVLIADVVGLSCSFAVSTCVMLEHHKRRVLVRGRRLPGPTSGCSFARAYRQVLARQSGSKHTTTTTAGCQLITSSVSQAPKSQSPHPKLTLMRLLFAGWVDMKSMLPPPPSADIRSHILFPLATCAQTRPRLLRAPLPFHITRRRRRRRRVAPCSLWRFGWVVAGPSHEMQTDIVRLALIGARVRQPVSVSIATS